MNKRKFKNGSTVMVERTRAHADGSFRLELYCAQEWPSHDELREAYAPGRDAKVWTSGTEGSLTAAPEGVGA